MVLLAAGLILEEVSNLPSFSGYNFRWYAGSTSYYADDLPPFTSGKHKELQIKAEEKWVYLP